jgi:O-methyltransferase
VFAEPRHPSVEDCDFYTTMTIPGVGLVEGQWDFRGHEAEYLGHVDFAGKRVLEIGPASGFFTAYMEQAGAQVVAVETDPEQPWDMVPQPHVAEALRERTGHMERLRNSWWLVHDRFGLHAQVHYGHGANLPDLGEFDIAVLGAVLVHCRHPLDVLESAARRARTVVVVDLFHSHLSGPVCSLMPSRENGRDDAWWELSPDLLVRFLEILGYREFRETRHVHEFEGAPWTFFTLVAER